MSLIVNEIFLSIQGESLYAGLPCVFVRLTGCNLRCRFCDTVYAYHEGAETPIAEIIKQVDSYGFKLVEITGGEPLLQKNTSVLAKLLLEAGYEVLIETNGSKDISLIDSRCKRIMDVKCPGSNEAESLYSPNIKHLSANDQVKFVIGDRKDFDYAIGISKALSPDFPKTRLLFSPAYETLKPHILAEWILESKLPVRLHMQLHKLIWPGIDRGV